MSISNTHFRRSAQVSGAVGGSLQSLRDSVDEHGRVGGSAADSLSLVREFRRIGSVLARHGQIAYRQANLVGRHTYQQSDMYQNYLRHHGVEDHVAAVRRLADGRYIGLSVHRDHRERAFSQRDENLLRVLAALIHGRLSIRPSEGRHTPASLSPKLASTLDSMLDGDSEKEMARRLSLSPATVHQYVQTLYRIHNAHSRGELMSLYVRPGRFMLEIRPAAV